MKANIDNKRKTRFNTTRNSTDIKRLNISIKYNTIRTTAAKLY